jgi:hypothetical protein
LWQAEGNQTTATSFFYRIHFEKQNTGLPLRHPNPQNVLQVVTNLGTRIVVFFSNFSTGLMIRILILFLVNFFNLFYFINFLLSDY